MEIQLLAIDNFKDSFKDRFIDLKTMMQEYKKSIHEEALNEEQFNDLKIAIDEGKIVFYIIVENKEAVGMCSVSILFSTYKCGPVGIFDDFYIKKEHRKKGFAKKLVSFVFNEMKAKKVTSLLLGCSDVDIEMYKHIGFNMELGNLLSAEIH